MMKSDLDVDNQGNYHCTCFVCGYNTEPDTCVLYCHNYSSTNCLQSILVRILLVFGIIGFIISTSRSPLQHIRNWPISVNPISISQFNVTLKLYSLNRYVSIDGWQSGSFQRCAYSLDDSVSVLNKLPSQTREDR
jgi:hypothetical protein